MVCCVRDIWVNSQWNLLIIIFGCRESTRPWNVIMHCSSLCCFSHSTSWFSCNFSTLLMIAAGDYKLSAMSFQQSSYFPEKRRSVHKGARFQLWPAVCIVVSLSWQVGLASATCGPFTHHLPAGMLEASRDHIQHGEMLCVDVFTEANHPFQQWMGWFYSCWEELIMLLKIHHHQQCAAFIISFFLTAACIVAFKERL